MSRSRLRKNRIDGTFAPRTIAMIGSPAFKALSLSARRILDRLEIELANHGGTDNGRLPCTYEHFIEFGLERHCIAAAIRELVALGFVEYLQGTAGNAEFRRPNTFRLTYRYTHGEPTDEWKRIRSDEEAMIAKRAARRSASGPGSPRKNRTPMRETHTEADAGKPH